MDDPECALAACRETLWLTLGAFDRLTAAGTPRPVAGHGEWADVS